MKRNIAFFITTNKDKNSLKQSKNDFLALAKRFHYEYEEINLNIFTIGIIYEDNFELIQLDDRLEFTIGNLGDSNINNDRFLKIKVLKETIKIENDYAGSIPVYYSSKGHLSLSNIESFTMLDSQTTQNDFSYENIYGFMKYMHFIWDETAHNHIFSMLPDSSYSFNAIELNINIKYLKTVYSTKNFEEISDEKVSSELNKLNDELVYKSLEKYDQIILPLSSGYDSRMILVSLAKRVDLKDKLYCFTYGSIGSIEVEAGRRLTLELGVKWDFIDLPLKFLTKEYLQDIHNVFGSSMHMHGMYQLEFFNEISKKIDIRKNACLTSGFMTGVPAGQHNSLLGIKNNNNLAKDMNKFPQSKYWSDEELNQLEIFKNKNYTKKANERFKMAFDRFEGEIYQKAVMFDVWTRQRNFIGYYPRTLEWKIATVSPHMNKRYANFFMSISKKHLDDRLSVELMFSKYYPKIASIVSNSNGLRSINSNSENIMLFVSRVFNKLNLNWLLPIKYANKGFEFDIPAVRHSKEDALYPLLNPNKDSIIHNILTKDKINLLYENVYKGDTTSYGKLITLQSLALSILKMEQKYES